jgi:hypothetical protein
MLAGMKANGRGGGEQGTIIGKGNLDELLSATPSLPLQDVKLIHRFGLLRNTPEVDNADGSFINMVDVNRFPVAKDMAGALVRIAAGGMRQIHCECGCAPAGRRGGWVGWLCAAVVCERVAAVSAPVCVLTAPPPIPPQPRACMRRAPQL